MRISALLLAVAVAIQPIKADTKAMYLEYINEVCVEYAVSPELVEAMIEAESSWNINAESSCGAVGLMQIMPCWHEDRMARLEISDPKDPFNNIWLAVDYIAELMETYEDPAEVLMIYNEGWNGSKRYRAGITSYYAESILKRANELEEHRRTENERNAH